MIISEIEAIPTLAVIIRSETTNSLSMEQNLGLQGTLRFAQSDRKNNQNYIEVKNPGPEGHDLG